MYTVLRLVSVLIFPSVRQQICFMTMSHRGKLPPVHFSTFLKKLLDRTLRTSWSDNASGPLRSAGFSRVHNDLRAKGKVLKVPHHTSPSDACFISYNNTTIIRYLSGEDGIRTLPCPLKSASYWLHIPSLPAKTTKTELSYTLACTVHWNAAEEPRGETAVLVRILRKTTSNFAHIHEISGGEGLKYSKARPLGVLVIFLVQSTPNCE